MKYAEHIIATLKAVTAMTGIPMLWRFPPLRYFHADYCHHGNRYCRKIKTLSGGSDRCNHDDSTGLVADAVEAQGCFLKKCHGGVVEMVMPVFDRGNLIASLVFGPFRPETPCPYAAAAEEFDRLPSFEQFPLKAEIEAIFALLADYLVKAQGNESVAAVKDSRVARAIDYVNANFHRKIMVDEVSRLCFLSKSRFDHLFSQECGMSFKQYVNLVRIRKAENLLLFSGSSPAEIAEMTGFCSQSHFTAAFKAQKGLPPMAYRRKFF